MNIKIISFLFFLAFLISGIIVYAMHSSANECDFQNLLVSLGFLGICAPLIGAMGLECPDKRRGLMLKVDSTVWFVTILMAQIIMVLVGVSKVAYICTTGLILLLYLASYYSILRSEIK